MLVILLTLVKCTTVEFHLTLWQFCSFIAPYHSAGGHRRGDILSLYIYI